MKAGFIKHSFILLIVCVALLGADTNDTLINANQKIYKNLLLQIKEKLKILKNDIDKTKNNNPSLYRKFMIF